MNDQQSYYETMYILRPDIAEDEVTNHICLLYTSDAANEL